MIVTVFRSRLMPDVREDYVALADRMNEIARTMPGYISHKGFFAEDGERVTVVEFEDEEAMRAWRMHPEHRAAQEDVLAAGQLRVKACAELEQAADAPPASQRAGRWSRNPREDLQQRALAGAVTAD